jgi:hypothetical protein
MTDSPDLDAQLDTIFGDDTDGPEPDAAALSAEDKAIADGIYRDAVRDAKALLELHAAGAHVGTIPLSVARLLTAKAVDRDALPAAYASTVWSARQSAEDRIANPR